MGIVPKTGWKEKEVTGEKAREIIKEEPKKPNETEKENEENQKESLSLPNEKAKKLDFTAPILIEKYKVVLISLFSFILGMLVVVIQQMW